MRKCFLYFIIESAIPGESERDGGTMHTHRFQFRSQLALVCVIVPVFAGIGPMIRNIEAFLSPTSADSSKWATIPEMPSLPEPSLGNYSVVIGQTVFRYANSWQETTERLWDDKATSLTQWGEDEPSLVLSDRLSGTPTASQDPIENLASDGLDFDVLDTTRADTTPVGIEEHTPAACYDEEQGTRPRISFEQFTDGNDTTRTIAPLVLATRLGGASRSTERFAVARQKVKEKSDTVGVNLPAKQAPIKVQTKIKCIETILKKAIIEPHLVNGQTEGLRITGLERISLARELLLRSGDIIRAINGLPLTSKRRAYKILKRARTQSTMRVELLRDGETKALLFKLL